MRKAWIETETNWPSGWKLKQYEIPERQVVNHNEKPPWTWNWCLLIWKAMWTMLWVLLPVTYCSRPHFYFMYFSESRQMWSYGCFPPHNTCALAVSRLTSGGRICIPQFEVFPSLTCYPLGTAGNVLNGWCFSPFIYCVNHPQFWVCLRLTALSACWQRSPRLVCFLI